MVIGAEESLVTISPGSVVRFEDTAHLGSLTVADYLTIGLYQNNDSANVLWEFEFELLKIVADMNNNGQIVRHVTEGQIADTTNAQDFPFLFWINDDDDENHGHSAQYYSNFLGRMDYWDNVLFEFELKDNEE